MQSFDLLTQAQLDIRNLTAYVIHGEQIISDLRVTEFRHLAPTWIDITSHDSGAQFKEFLPASRGEIEARLFVSDEQRSEIKAIRDFMPAKCVVRIVPANCDVVIEFDACPKSMSPGVYARRLGSNYAYDSHEMGYTFDFIGIGAPRLVDPFVDAVTRAAMIGKQMGLEAA